MKVMKRGGEIRDFDVSKIHNAIDKAFLDVRKENIPEWFKLYVASYFFAEPDDRLWKVEEIQDKVEERLMEWRFYDVARSYIKYRGEHADLRLLKERQEYIDSYILSGDNAASTSETDANANVSVKNVANLYGELWKTNNRRINRFDMRRWIKKLYGESDPGLDRQYAKDLEDHIIYVHDESNTAVGTNYCQAVSMWDFAIHGTTGLDGGGHTAPHNLHSFAGQFGNLVFLLSSQIKGACMYKDQGVFIKYDGIVKFVKSQDLFGLFFDEDKVVKFSNSQGDWEYIDICDKDVFIAEDGKFVKLRKVFRRGYQDDIYKISMYSPWHKGMSVCVTKDHIFKQFMSSRVFEQKAKYLKENDTVFVNRDYSFVLDSNSKDWKKGWLVGIICGDGHLSGDRNFVELSVNNEQEYLCDIFNNYCTEILGVTFNINKGHRCISLQKSDPSVRKFFNGEIVGHTVYDKHIVVEGKSIDYLLGFLDGLFCADGSYTQAHGISLSLSNKSLSDNVCDIIDILGVQHSALHLVPGKGNRVDSYSQYISSTILKYLVFTCKKIRLRSNGPEKYRKDEVYHYGYNAFRGTSKDCDFGYIKSWKKAKKEFEYKTEVIEGISVFKNDHPYVYEVETDSHWYNCGGFITHNCAYGEFFNYMDHYIAGDFGEDYHLREDDIAWNFPKKTKKEVILQYFQQITHTINQPAGNRGYQSPFTNISYYDSNYWHAVFQDFQFPDGSRPVWERVSYLQKLYMNWFNEERTKTLLTFPVETMALLSDGKDIIDKDYKEFTAEMYAKGHSFFTYISDNPDSLASCCRLRNEIQENTFSFTNGLTGVQTGSANVITLNMSRIIQNWAREKGFSRDFLKEHFFEVSESFVEYLKFILERYYKYQTAYKERLYNLERHNMLTASNAGYISMSKLYSTCGLNGLNEAAEFVGLQCRYNETYQRFCNLVTGTISSENKRHNKPGYLFNTELVPAESLSSKNYNWDKEDGYWVPEDRVLYNSYFYKADDPDTSVLEKFRLHGSEFTKTLDGGVGLHCNLAEHLSKEQYLHLIDFAVENGTSYFTFNIPNSECSNKECHYIVKKPLDVCPKCGAPMNQYTRIIGYLRPVKDFDRFRRIEARRRYYAPAEKATEGK